MMKFPHRAMKIMSVWILNLAMHQRLASRYYFTGMYPKKEDPDRYHVNVL
jgi:hypothetical protein